jgi:hypothetical protein
MTNKADFTEDEWRLVLEGPPSAGMLVVTASKGGMFRETFAMSKAYAEARAEHGTSELLDAVVAARPQLDHRHAGSAEEVRTHLLQVLSDATALVASKGTPDELVAYRKFIIALSEKVAAAHREHGVQVNDQESGAIDAINGAIGATGS